jgi:hypothetical protein
VRRRGNPFGCLAAPSDVTPWRAAVFDFRANCAACNLRPAACNVIHIYIYIYVCVCVPHATCDLQRATSYIYVYIMYVPHATCDLQRATSRKHATPYRAAALYFVTRCGAASRRRLRPPTPQIRRRAQRRQDALPCGAIVCAPHCRSDAACGTAPAARPRRSMRTAAT